VRLYDKEAVSEWVQHQGVDAEEFFDVYDSFSVSAAVRRGDQRSIAHRVDSVPTLTIDGRFRVAITDNGTVEHFERQLSGVSELIDAIRVEKGL
jgi:predicted DsbA family dithiol-disulfide isomerase